MREAEDGWQKVEPEWRPARQGSLSPTCMMVKKSGMCAAVNVI